MRFPAGPRLEWSGAELPADWQGILFVEIVAGPPTQVVARLNLDPDGLTQDDVEVVGGKPTPSKIEFRFGAAPAVVATFDSTDDRTPYVFRLLDGGDAPLHPFFYEAPFRFFLECEGGDCRPSGRTAEKPPGLPPSFDARNKDFRGFMRALEEWARVSNPDWSDLSPASQELMLLELLAHHADMLSAYQDRVANEAFVATASERHSLRQHAVLLGRSVFEGQAATTWLAFDVAAAGIVPEHALVASRAGDGERRVVFHVVERTRVDPANNSSALVLAAWPNAPTASVARGSKELRFFGHENPLAAKMRLAFVQGDLSQVVEIDEVLRLESPGWALDPNDPLLSTPSPVTLVLLHEPLKFALHPWPSNRPDKLRIHANLVRARHGEPRSARTEVGVPPGSPAADDRAITDDRRSRVVVSAPRGGAFVRQLRAVKLPDGPVLHASDEDGRSLPLLTVRVGGERWTREDHLHGGEPYDLHYTTGTEESGDLWVEFGDGVHAREVEVDALGRPKQRLEFEYFVGHAADGVCGLGALTEFVPPIDVAVTKLGVLAATNVTRGEGGRRPDTLDDVREDLPRSLRHDELQRAVATADYAAAARVPGVSRAAARPLRGPFNSVLVLVDAEDQTALPPDVREAVSRRIDERRMAGREHFVEAAEYVPLRVELVLCAEPGFERHCVREDVLARLRPGTDERRGFFHPDELSFGQDLDAARLLAFVQRIPGVRSVKAVAFCRLLAPKTSESRIVLGETEVARLDADDRAPQHGILIVSVVGLDRADEALVPDDAEPEIDA